MCLIYEAVLHECYCSRKQCAKATFEVLTAKKNVIITDGDDITTGTL